LPKVLCFQGILGFFFFQRQFSIHYEEGKVLSKILSTFVASFIKYLRMHLR